MKKTIADEMIAAKQGWALSGKPLASGGDEPSETDAAMLFHLLEQNLHYDERAQRWLIFDEAVRTHPNAKFQDRLNAMFATPQSAAPEPEEEPAKCGTCGGSKVRARTDNSGEWYHIPCHACSSAARHQDPVFLAKLVHEDGGRLVEAKGA